MTEPLHILILEDNPTDADLIQFELQEAKLAFIPKVVVTKKEFIRELSASCPDLILSDYDLPQYNGALALAEAKKRCPDTPFILVTGAVSEDLAIEILTKGAKDYVLKNRLQQRLVPAVRRALTEAEEHHARKQAEAELREAHDMLEERVKIRTTELHVEMAARKRVEEELREAYERTTAILESIADAFFSLDDQWRFMAVNPAAERAPFGRPANELLGKVIWDVFPAIVGTRIHRHYLDAVEKCSREHYEAQSPLNGHWYEVFMFPRANGLDVYLRDITERKRVEAALRDSEQLYRAIGESINYGVWVCAPDGRNIYASESFLKLVGLTQEQCSNFGWGDVLHPDDAETTIAAWKECVRTGGIWDIEHRFRGVDGRWHPILARGVPVRNEKGEVICWAGINLDISNLKKAEISLKERTHQLEDVNSELESFSYSVSHDLRVPLRAIDGYSRMILREQGGKFDENTKNRFNVIRDNVKLMNQLINDLLAFSRLGREALSLSRLNMDDLAKDAWGELITINFDSRVDFKIDSLPPVMGDRSLIRQVLVNLLSNALKFSKVRETPLIEVGGHSAEGENVYYVRDNGVGFDMQYYKKLFGVFQRLHSADDYEGTGVGLAIVQRIILRHDGRIWAEGVVDKGATFYFTLPAGMKDPSDKRQR
jgi:PAS domain S-box-containing protein